MDNTDYISLGTELTNCPLCGANDTALYLKVPVRPDQRGHFRTDVWDLVRCRQCGFIYVNPRPDKHALDVIYSFPNPVDRDFIQNWFIDGAFLHKAHLQRYIDILAKYCPHGSILDVGCGAGTFLTNARERGYQVYGLEVAPFFIDFCRNQQGLEIFEGELDQLALSPNRFDVITLFDVIEHVLEPDKLIKTCYPLLKPGGIIILGTHDIGNWMARLYGTHWRLLLPIGHLTYFNRATLSRLLEQNGFKVLKAGAGHTIDVSLLKEIGNFWVEFSKTILLRSFILGVYKPLARLFPQITHWQIKMKANTLNHRILMARTGDQIIMNDEIVIVAARNG